MSQPFPRLIPLLVLALVAAGAGLVATRSVTGRGGGGSGARQAVQQALGPSREPESGRFDATLDVDVRGAASPQLSGPFSMRISGAFDARSKAQRPRVSLDASVNAAGRDLRFGVVSSGTRAFVRLGSNFYVLPPSELARLYGQSTGGPSLRQSLADFGIDRGSWLKNARDEGSTTVGSVRSRHVSADVDTNRLIEDLVAVARRLQPTQGFADLSDEDVQKLKDAIKNARIEVYSGEADGIFRKAVVHGHLVADNGSGDFDFNLELSEVNKPQHFAIPTQARPFGQLEGDSTVNGLAALTGGPGAQASGTGRASGRTTSSPTTPGAAAPALPGEAQAYLGCVRKAHGPAELERCTALLP